MRWAPPTSMLAGLWLLLACTAPRSDETTPDEDGTRRHGAERAASTARAHEHREGPRAAEVAYDRSGLMLRDRAQPLTALPPQVRTYAHAADQARLAYADFGHAIEGRPFETSIYVINDSDDLLPLRLLDGRGRTVVERYSSRSGWVRLSPSGGSLLDTSSQSAAIPPHSFMRIAARRPRLGTEGRIRFRVATEPPLTTNVGTAGAGSSLSRGGG